MDILRLGLILIILGVSSIGFAQENRLKGVVNGTIVNAASLASISNAHILIKDKSIGTITNHNGEFNIHLTVNDSLMITCVGYKTYLAVVSADHVNGELMHIRLFPDTITLDPVYIHPWPSSISEFKKVILETNGNKNSKVKNAERNMAILEYTGRYGGMIKVEMDGYDNFLNTTNGPQGVNIRGGIGLLFSVISGELLPGSYKHFNQKMKGKL